jgi:predicted SprT family Zn-dependent metalloprotease
MTEKKCFSCGNTSNEAPLLTVEVKGETKYACVRCMPRLIHGG